MAEAEERPGQASGLGPDACKKRKLDPDMDENGAPKDAESRQELAQAHNKFLDRLAQRLEAKYLKEKEDLRKELQDDFQKKTAELEDQHKAAQADWESMLARRDRDSKLFTFTVQGCDGPGLSGCLPRQIFDAEPNSALAHVYNGEWQYSTDDKGRAVINSDPAHWPIIVRWLSFGTVPPNPTPEFISECKYWQLDRLLEAIHAQDAPACSGSFQVRRAVADDCYGFTAEADISNFRERLENAFNASSALILPFKAAGRDWYVQLHQKHFNMHMVNGSALQVNAMRAIMGACDRPWQKRCSHSPTPVEKGMHFGWKLDEKQVEQLMHPKLLSVDGSMHLAITITFKI